MRSKTQTAAVMAVAMAFLAGTEAFATSSAPVRVDCGLCGSHWATVFTNTVGLAWEWRADADEAVLDIVGMSGSVTTNFTTAVSNWLWRAFVPAVPAAEDVYDLTLTFKNGGSVVGVQTARLAVVTGAFGKTAVDSDPAGALWSKVKENVVIPYDAGWSEATAVAGASRLVIAKDGGAAQTNALADTGGYFGWKLRKGGWGYGVFNLALTFPETAGEWDATVVRPMEGTLIRMQ